MEEGKGTGNAKKDEAVRLGEAMVQKRKSQIATPVATPQLRLSGAGNKSPRSSKRDSGFEGLAAQGEEKVSVAESALARAFRLLADVFDEDKPSSAAAKRDALQRYREMIDVQESNLKGAKEEKATRLVAEHRQVAFDFEAMLS
jgi:hypothetical protein